MNDPTDQQRIVVSSAADLLASVPYMLGFHPADSLVVIALQQESGSVRFMMRLDLPTGETDARQTAHDMIARLTLNAITTVILVGYGTGSRVTPTIDVFLRVLGEKSITVAEALRVAEGRYWSYVCTDPRCCPPDGTPFDVSATVVAAQAVINGQTARADRDELVRSVAPITGPERTAMRRATRNAEGKLLNWSEAAGPDWARSHMVEQGLNLVRELRERTRDGYESLPNGRVAWLGILLMNLRVRDEAWVLIESGGIAPQIDLWRDVTRRVERLYVPAPACLLAFAAFLSGDGALANVALDRALEAEPGYSMAHLLRETLNAGIDPAKVRGLLTPEQLAEAYERLASGSTEPRES